MGSSLSRSDWVRIAIASLLALAALAVVSGLGLWQFSRAHRDDITRQVLAAPAAPVQSLVQPRAYVSEFDFAHAVTVSGTMDGSKALMSCRTDATCLVFAPVDVGSSLSVVVVTGEYDRSEAVSQLTQLREGQQQSVLVNGRLQPAEVIARPAALRLPTDDVQFISTNELVLRWGIPLLDGYVVQDGVDVELVTPPSGISWRNLAYAWQWWAFAAFIVFLLTRYIMDVRADSIRANGRS